MAVAHWKINTNDVIWKGRPSMALSPDWCVVCKNALESIDPLFLHCPAAFFLWSKLFRTFKLSQAVPATSFSALLQNFLRVKGRGMLLSYGIVQLRLHFGSYGLRET